MIKLSLSVRHSLFIIFGYSLLFSLSCNKDKGYLEGPKTKQQLIKFEVIQKWFASTPGGTLLTLDWKHAKQAEINGNKIVRVPTANVDNTSFFNMGGNITLSQPQSGGSTSSKIMDAKIADISPSITGRNKNYFDSHPPEVFFVQRANSNKLSAKMLNFIPADLNNDFGKDGIWTGLLYSWDLNGDTLTVKKLEKSKVIDYYGLRNPESVNAKTNARSSDYINEANINVQSSFFGWFADLVGDIVGWIAYQLGASVTYYSSNNGYGAGWRIDVKQSTIVDNTDGTQGGGGSYDAVDASYLDGSNSQTVYDQYPYPDGSGTNQIYNNVKLPAALMYLISVLDLHDTDLQDYLWQNMILTNAFVEYLDSHGISPSTIAYAKWGIQYTKDRPSGEQELETFITNFLGTSEGADGDVDDQNFYSNTVSQHQNLPTLMSYYQAYPSWEEHVGLKTYVRPYTNHQVYAMVGGSLNTKHINGNSSYQNACAIRGSRALNYCGLDIPVYVYGNKLRTEQGADGKNYILSAEAFNHYMHATFGPPTDSLNNFQIHGDMSIVAKFLVGKSGIFTVLNNSLTLSGATGHIDIIINGRVPGWGDPNTPGGIKKIEYWKLE